MESSPNIPLLILVSSSIGLLSAFLAYRNGKNPYLWFFIGIIFGLLGVIALFFISPKTKISTPDTSSLAKQLYIEGPEDRFWYYLDKMRKQQGPMSHDAITQAWKKGEVAPSTLIWHEDLSNWKQLQDLIKEREIGKA